MEAVYPPTDEGTWFEEEKTRIMADPELRKLYAEESTKMALWLQLVEARIASGLTEAQVAERMGVSQAKVALVEKQGYDAYTRTPCASSSTLLALAFLWK